MIKTVFLTFSLICTSLIYSQSPLWLRYPSISPNGKEVAFCYKGKIYKVNSKGGTASLVVNNEFYSKSPQWSPDGKTIAYASSKHGNFDVFRRSSNGENEKRLTFYSGDEIPTSITPDNKKVLFSAMIMDNHLSSEYPDKGFSELYEVPLNGGRVKQVLSIPAEHAKYNKSQTALLFQDYKGYENKWRKHHTSEVTRDIWIKKNNDEKFKKLSTFKCENRNPVFSSDEKHVYFLTEKTGSFNVFKLSLTNNSAIEQISFHEKHPVRFLSVAENGTLCYAFNGKLFVKTISDNTPKELKIVINDTKKNTNGLEIDIKKQASEMAVSPNGKEVAIIYRGEVFITDVNSKKTKQITHTASQERSISFSPDGKSILYAGERKGSWNIYVSTIKDSKKSFLQSKNIVEEVLINTNNEEFQPKYSPNGKEVAYLEERTSMKIKNLENNQTRLVYDGSKDYSYADGDQKFEWSPNGNWILQSSENNLFLSDIYLVNAKKLEAPIDLTQSGYNDTKPKWGMNGEMITWTTDKYSMRKQAVWWGARTHIYGMFFDKKAYDVFKLSKEDYEASKSKTYQFKEQNLEYSNRQNQKIKLIDEDQVITDHYITKKGDKLFYLVSKSKRHELWFTDVRNRKDSCIVRFPKSGNSAALWKNKGDNTSLLTDKKENNIFVFIKGYIYKINTKTYQSTPINYEVKMKVNLALERAYLFEHSWRQVSKKFYRKDIHHVDWNFYKSEYVKFLPHINNNFDFSEMLSEMLGELNGSHTGCRYKYKLEKADKTARLGLFLDYTYANGIKIDEVITGGPFDNADSKVKKGNLILSIDGNELKNHNDFEFLNNKSGKNTAVKLYDEDTKTTWIENIKPISIGSELNLLYKRWVNNKREITSKKSNGKIGYVHIKSMSDASLRETYSDALGLNKNKQAIVIDTRHNGGGWLHDNLVDLFNGTVYLDFKIRDVPFGNEPMNKWSKKSILLMSEDNYSDANGFPYAYKTLKLGKIVGKPVAGTMTAVWWEKQMTGDLVFGIPQVGTINSKGEYLENMLLEPDYDVSNDYNLILKGIDHQLEIAIDKLKN